MSLAVSLSNSFGPYYQSPRSGSFLEEKLAREIQRQKAEQEAQRREINKILSESEELQNFRAKIKAAYVNKERAAQITESQIRKLDDIKRDAEMDDIMLTEENKLVQRARQKEMERQTQIKIGGNLLKAQIEERRQQSYEAYQQYLREKEHVDLVIQKMMDEERRLREEAGRKKQQVMRDMTWALDQKKENRIKEKEMDEQEYKRCMEYSQKVDDRENKLRAQRIETELAKEQVLSKMRAIEEEKMRQKAVMDELRLQLQKEEFDMEEQIKQERERQKVQMHKTQLMQAEKISFANKLDKEQEEARIREIERRELEEQYARNVQREKEIREIKKKKDQELKQEADKYIYQRWLAYNRAREEELMEVKRQKEEERRKQEIIKQEKERLMREHLPYLTGFLSPGSVGSPTKNSEFMSQNRSKIYF